MARDYFAILGLTPGAYQPAEIERRFRAERQRCLTALHAPTTHGESRNRLDDLHAAYRTLADPGRQEAYLAAMQRDDDPVAQMRRLIDAALEDGLLRYSRRREILERGRTLGFSEFQVHLLIAQVQFGDAVIDAPPPKRRWSLGAAAPAAQVVGVLLLAAAISGALLRVLGWL